MQQAEYKRCSKCKQTRHRDEFYLDRHRRDGLTSWCTACYGKGQPVEPLPIPERLDLPDAYFAGLFDGEGHIGIRRSYDTSLFLLSCSVSNTHEGVLYEIQDRFGGSVCRGGRLPPNCKPIYIWRADSAKADAFLRPITPFLVVKRERAELALKFRELFRGANVMPRGHSTDTPRNQAKCARILTARRECYERMAVLNRRGIA